MSLRSLLSALTWRDAVCALRGCRHERLSYDYFAVCVRCGRPGFVARRRS